MRTAEAILRDMRKLGRNNEQVLIVARHTHGGRFFDRMVELLSMPAEEAEALAPAPEPEPEEVAEDAPQTVEVRQALCPECGTPLNEDGDCVNWLNHEVKVFSVDDDDQEEPLLDKVTREAVGEYYEQSAESEVDDPDPDPQPSPPKKKKRRTL